MMIEIKNNNILLLPKIQSLNEFGRKLSMTRHHPFSSESSSLSGFIIFHSTTYSTEKKSFRLPKSERSFGSSSFDGTNTRENEKRKHLKMLEKMWGEHHRQTETNNQGEAKEGGPPLL